MLDVNQKEIEQMRLELHINKVCPIISKFKEDAQLELWFRKKLSTSEIKEDFTIFYSSEQAIKVKEEGIIYNFIFFLENIEYEGGKDRFLDIRTRNPNVSWLLKRYDLKIFYSI